MFSSRKTSAPSTGYNLTKSLRFRSSASAYLSRTPSVASNQTTWTFSAWLKRGTISTSEITLFGKADTYISVNSNQLNANFSNGGSNYFITSSAVLVDPSAWYHVVLVLDTTQATAANRASMYVNGVKITSFATSTYTNMAQNYNAAINTAAAHAIGRYSGATPGAYLDGYLAEVNFIDGQALTPSSFGSFSGTGGVWQPIAYSGTYGTNGFHLTFANTTSTTTLGYDTSGNSNNWTTNNISLTAGSTYDSMNDVPVAYSATASNYCVSNPLDTSTSLTTSNGNLTMTGTSAAWFAGRSTFGMTTGKWYWEVYCNSISLNPDYRALIGIMSAQGNLGSFVGSDAYGWGYYSTGGDKYHSGSGAGSYGASFVTGDTVGVAFDATNGTITFYKNGTSQGVAYTGIPSSTYFPSLSVYGSTAQISANFGQQGFTYTPPSGYVALNTYNLPTPTIAQGNQYMAATTWTSVGGTETVMNTVNGISCQPDFVWLKNRSISQNNYLADSNRGISKYFVSNTTSAEVTDAPFVTALNSNGFSLGVDGFANGQSIVAWQWQANKGTNVSNTNGTITSTVSANTTAGFSIVTYTGTGTAGTIGHGLGVAPSMIIVKSRSATGDWPVYHSSLGNGSYALLDTTAASASSSTIWNATSPTSSVFSVGINTVSNTVTVTYVAYCFAPIAGFSAFGSYTGNGSATGPFIYTGFRPKFLMIKRTDSISDWSMLDSSRNTYNSLGEVLNADTYGVGGTYTALNFLSNGFNLVWSDTSMNASGGTYIYMAFAENPTKYALAR